MSDDSSSGHSLPWHPVTGVALVLFLYFAAAIVGALLANAAASLLRLDIESTAAQFLYVLTVEVLTIGGLAFFLKRRGVSFARLGFVKPRLKHIGIGLAVYPLYFIAFAILAVLASVLFPEINLDQEQQLGFDNVQGVVALTLTFISLVILPPLVEELTVRGMLFTSLRSKLPFFVSALLTSILFALAHITQGGDQGLLYVAALDTFALSIVLCLLREKTGSLWPGITLHALKNSIAFVSLYIIVIR